MTVLRAWIVFVFASLITVPMGASAEPGRADDPGKAEGVARQQGKKRFGPGRGPHGRGGRMGLRGEVSKEIMGHLYPVGLVRRYAADLKLTDKQIEKLRNIVTKVHAEVEGLKWDVERESQKLGDLVKSEAPLKKIYKQMDKVLGYENQIKKKHLGLLITVRDILTPAQRKFLDELKRSKRGRLGSGKKNHLKRRGSWGEPHALAWAVE